MKHSVGSQFSPQTVQKNLKAHIAASRKVSARRAEELATVGLSATLTKRQNPKKKSVPAMRPASKKR